ncbi:MerR family transcriptional regulator [Actinoplanes utahensis]|uniref:MerR family transcriptional regulator n=1 Tax=Actinoplanes utahensis TaxID=1869 RepID=A0A0A6UQZ6_ACTUT|nr:GyrI-like domain-containing protein [Actinoplanes utahensis]KHD77468.1 MerR family transcriptional regulator [Actinoplanes utahensis]GIF32592.1 hypothetical protein Aut01nite_55780 [Actinoplanes utahensis]
MDDLLPISAFSRATLISANTLRAYHESGLLEPAVVDPRTGYRGYRVAQFGDAAVIRSLRELDVPLAAIREVLAARDPAVTRRVLAEHRERTLARQAHIEHVLHLTEGLLDDPAAVTPATVTERTLPSFTAYTITREVTEEEFPGFLGEAFVLLGRHRAAGPPGALFPVEYQDGPSPVTAFVPAAGGPETLPGGRFAIAEFTGPYADMSAGYRSLGVWLAGSGHAIAGRVRENYLLGPGETASDQDYRTEICWPITVQE